MMTTATAFESKIIAHLTRREPFRIRDKTLELDQKYKLEDIWYEPSGDGRTVHVSFRAVLLPVEYEIPPGPYSDLDPVNHPEVHRGEPPSERELSFEVEVEDVLEEDKDFQTETDRHEHHGERTYYYTFTDGRPDEKLWERFQAFLDGNVLSPEAIQAENRRVWAEGFDEVQKSRARERILLTPELMSHRDTLEEKSADNLQAARFFLAAYYAAGMTVFLGTNLLMLYWEPMRRLLSQAVAAPAVCVIGSVITFLELIVLKICVTRAQRDYTAALLYREGMEQLAQPAWVGLAPVAPTNPTTDRIDISRDDQKKSEPSERSSQPEPRCDYHLVDAAIEANDRMKIAWSDLYVRMSVRRSQAPVRVIPERSPMVAGLVD